MASFEFLALLLTGLGLMASILYYTSVLSNANKTRKTQLYMQLYNRVTDKLFIQNYGDTLNMEWSDYEDFERKWGSGNNTDAYSKRYSVWYAYDGVGYLLSQGLIDLEMAYHLNGTAALYQWEKYGDIIHHQRQEFNIPELAVWFEYLVEELKKKRESLGYSGQVPENYGRLFEDKSTQA